MIAARHGVGKSQTQTYTLSALKKRIVLEQMSMTKLSAVTAIFGTLLETNIQISPELDSLSILLEKQEPMGYQIREGR